jgi:O-antigen ligase
MSLQHSSIRTPIRTPIRQLPKPRTRKEKLAERKAIVAEPRLRMSDYWFLAGLLLALFYVADPFRWYLERLGPTKHLPMMIVFAGVVLTNIGHWLFAPPKKQQPDHWQVLRVGLPLVLLGTWIVLGSVYARKFEGINATFFIVGLYMLFAFMVARVVVLSPARAAIVRYFLIGCAVAAFFMILVMAATMGNLEVVTYHEMEALVVPIAVYFALRPMRSSNWRALLVLTFLLVGGLVFRKNTGFLVLGLTALYLWIVEWRFRFRENGIFRLWTVLWLAALIGAGSIAYSYIAYQRGTVMPTGNPEYRLRTYERAWERFLESPVLGTSFTEQATEKFKGYQIKTANGILATHSDVLDLAAQGGAVALLLWIWGYVRIIRFSMRHALRGRPRDDLRAAAHALACMSLTSIVVYAFNPILLQPAKALLLWAQLGMLIGITLHLDNIEKSTARQSAQQPTAKRLATRQTIRSSTTRPTTSKAKP